MKDTRKHHDDHDYNSHDPKKKKQKKENVMDDIKAEQSSIIVKEKNDIDKEKPVNNHSKDQTQTQPQTQKDENMNSTRKRRLSRKERKAMKKQKVTTTTTTTITKKEDEKGESKNEKHSKVKTTTKSTTNVPKQNQDPTNNDTDNKNMKNVENEKEDNNKNKNLDKKKKKKKKKQKKSKQQQQHKEQDESNDISKNSSEKTTTSTAPAVTVDDEEDETELMKSYQPIPVPERPAREIVHNNSMNNTTKQNRTNANNNDDVMDEGGGGAIKTLGKWFPNALLIKCMVNYTNTGQLLLNDKTITDPNTVKVNNPCASLVLFYQYNNAKWTPYQLQLLMTYLQRIAQKPTSNTSNTTTFRHIGGRIRVSQEGVNATISSIDMPHCTAKETLRHFAQDLKNFDPIVFAKTDFKYIDHLPADRHFKELKVIPVQELVFYDIAPEEAPLDDDDNNANTDTNTNDNNKSKTTTTSSSTTTNGLRGGIHLDAKEYHEMLKKENTVVIDVRNHYETIIGRFDGQVVGSNKSSNSDKQDKDENKKKKRKIDSQDGDNVEDEKDDKMKKEENAAAAAAAGAEYLDPLMRKSTDFKSWLAKKETQEKLKDKTVLMYCTGGIRCERASAYLKKEMGPNVEGVYQLQGGIERYLKAFPDGGFWRGKNFVFDKREAVGVNNPQGDGGVIRKQDIKKQNKQKVDGKDNKNNDSSDTNELPSKCVVCAVTWDRYVGKKKCFTCGVPVLMCDKCMSLKPDKTPGMQLKVRCPLCVAENVTVPASEVDWTANGMKSKQILQQNGDDQKQQKQHKQQSHGKNSNNTNPSTTANTGDGDNNNNDNKEIKKAAESVLKWGGGHASNKKLGRKVKGRVCRFGVECVRKDCIFAHPDGRGV